MTLRMLDAADAAADADAFRSLRLEALLNAPAAFASSYEDEVARSLVDVAGRLTPGHDGVTLGAFVAERLVGTVGVRRLPRRKERHEAFIWGMDVTPRARGRGAGRRLAAAALDHAATMPGLRQVVLGVGAENRVARRIYDELGFEPFGVERDALVATGSATTRPTWSGGSARDLPRPIRRSPSGSCRARFERRATGWRAPSARARPSSCRRARRRGTRPPTHPPTGHGPSARNGRRGPTG